MSCLCAHARTDHFHDGRCTLCDRCYQYESAGGVEERMGTTAPTEHHPIHIVHRVVDVPQMGMPRGDE